MSEREPGFIEIHHGQEAERKREKMDTLIGKRHRTAVIASRLEQDIAEFAEDIAVVGVSRRDAAKQLSEWMDKKFAHLQPELRERYTFYANQYFDMVRGACQQEQKFKQRLKINEWTETDRERIAVDIFKQRTGTEPIGKVRLERCEGYLIFSFEYRADYEKVHHGSKKVDDVISEPIGRFCKKFDLPSARVGQQQQLSSVLLTYGIEPTHNRVRYIVAHEKQHFFDRIVLNRFQGIETANPNLSNIEEGTQRRIKDEILAHLRGGVDEEAIRDLPNVPSYHARFFKNLSMAAQTEARQLIDRIAQCFKAVLPLFPTLRERGVLVNHFLDISLNRFPEWIEEIGMFYQKRAADRKTTRGLRIQHVDVENDFIYPVGMSDEYNYKQVANQLRTVANSLEDETGKFSSMAMLDEEMSDDDLLRKGEKSIKLYQERYESMRKGLLRHYVHIPVVKEQFYIVPAVDDETNRAQSRDEKKWKKRLLPYLKRIINGAREAQQGIINILFDIPQDHIDDTFASLTDREDDTECVEQMKESIASKCRDLNDIQIKLIPLEEYSQICVEITYNPVENLEHRVMIEGILFTSRYAKERDAFAPGNKVSVDDSFLQTSLRIKGQDGLWGTIVDKDEIPSMISEDEMEEYHNRFQFAGEDWNEIEWVSLFGHRSPVPYSREQISRIKERAQKKLDTTVKKRIHP